MWQFMAGTARLYGLRVDYWVDERRDPFKSSEKAADHLRDLYARFGTWELALAAYNAGARSVERAIARAGSRDFYDLCSSGLLKRETRAYVPRFHAAAIIAGNPGEYGFVFAGGGGFPEYEVLRVEKTVDLTVLGERSGAGAAALRLLNPELRRAVTPVGERYDLRVPKQHFARALAAYRELPKSSFASVAPHRVKTGETLGEIAARYGTDLHMLKAVNGIVDSRRLRAGDRILVPVDAKRAAPEAVRDAGRGPGAGPGPAGQAQSAGAEKTFGAQSISYRVKEGDSVWSIARKYSTAVDRVLAANGLTFESVIKPGDEIELWLDLPLSP
jgi:membrane-bound lytic murein transglycosylase D